MFYDTSGWEARVREMFLDRSYGVTSAALGMYFPTFFLSSFLSLMKEKRAKENQGARGTYQVCRVREGAYVVIFEVGQVQEGAGVMFSNGGEWVIEVRKMFLDGNYGAAGATLGRSFPTFFLSSFLSLIKEKRAKENQAPTGGREVGRVQEGAGVVFYDVGGRAARVREMFFDGGYGAAGASLGRSFPTFSLSSFLSLMKEKRAKENQAPTGGGEVGRVQEGVEVVFFNWGGRAKKIPAKRLDGGNLRVVANDGMDYVGDSASGAFRSKMERRM